MGYFIYRRSQRNHWVTDTKGKKRVKMKGRVCTWEGRREQRIRDKREENQSVTMEKGEKERGKEIKDFVVFCQFST